MLDFHSFYKNRIIINFQEMFGHTECFAGCHRLNCTCRSLGILLIMRIPVLSLLIPFVFGKTVKSTLYKSTVSSTCKMSETENYSIAFVTISDKQAAGKLSDEMLNRKLIACVNIVSGVESRYVWEGKVNVDSEVLMIIKTRTSRLKELGELIKDKHPYDCPEFITTKIDDGNPAYLKWIGEIVPEK